MKRTKRAETTQAAGPLALSRIGARSRKSAGAADTRLVHAAVKLDGQPGKIPSRGIIPKPPDVLDHLVDSLQSGWKRYCKELKRCQKSFSEDAVHDSRVSTRRLLSTVGLLAAFIPEPEIKKARRALKDHLDTFDKLRDTQVQLDYVKRMEDGFKAATAFREWLKKREDRFTRKARKNVKCVKTKRTGKQIASFRKEICRLRKTTSRADAFRSVQLSMDRSFACVADLCRRVNPGETATIHRTRIAFKKFRYMVESLSPILPAVTEDHCRAMRGYQSMMGDIQDVEVLIGALEKFLRQEQVDAGSARRLREELMRRRQWLIRVYVNAAGRLRQFWPLWPALAANAKPKTATKKS
jgi:CHAD domain-containing protein